VSRSLAFRRDCSRQVMVALDRGQQEKAERAGPGRQRCPVDAESRAAAMPTLWRRGAKEGHYAIEAAGKACPTTPRFGREWREMQLAAVRSSRPPDGERALDLDTKLPGAWAIRGGVRGRPANRKGVGDYPRTRLYA